MRLKSQVLRISLTVLVTVLTSTFVAAQVSDREKAEKEREQRRELEKKTLSLLDDVTSEAWGLKLPANRSFIQATAADLLWTRNETRARSLYWEALNSLGLNVNVETNEKEPLKDAQAKASTAKTQTADAARSQRQQYFETRAARGDLLRSVARHDAQLALDMLRATRTSPVQVDPQHQSADETNLEQEIANEAAEHDPKKALQIAREVLAKGLTSELMQLVQRLNQQNREIATEFAGDIINKVQTANFATDLNARWIAGDLLLISRAPKTSTDDDKSRRFVWHHLNLSDDQKRKLVELLTDFVLSATALPNTLESHAELIPEFEQFAPDRAARFKIRLTQSHRTLTKEQKDWATYGSLFRNGTPEEMVTAGATVGDDQRQALFSQAVVFAVLRNRADALREFIVSNVKEDGRRQTLLDALDAEQLSAAVYQGKTDELRKLLPVIRLKEQRGRAMAELAILLEKKGEHDKALELLDEAKSLVKVDLGSETQSQALLTVLLAYALVDPPKAFAMIEPIIDRANENISKLLLVDKIISSGIVKNGEIMLNQSGQPLDFVILKYRPGAMALAKADFNRTKSLTDRFQRLELRLYARLLLAHSLLRGLDAPPEPEQSTQDNPK